MSPRIQVYNAIACRVSRTDSLGPVDFVSFATGSCEVPEVQARAAKIQACMFHASRIASPLISLPCSCGHNNERPQRNFDRLLESVGRYTRTKAHPFNLSYRSPLDARMFLSGMTSQKLTRNLHRESVFVLVMKPNSLFGRHAERLILLGPIFEGFVGGLSTFHGAVHA